MNNPVKSPAAINLGLLVARIPLGAFFLMTGLMKVADLGVKTFVQQYSGLLPEIIPKPIGQTYLYALPFIEMTVGALLILGLFTRTASAVACLVVITITIAATGPFMPHSHHTPHTNLIFIGLAFLLMTTGPGKVSVDNAAFGLDKSVAR